MSFLSTIAQLTLAVITIPFRNLRYLLMTNNELSDLPSHLESSLLIYMYLNNNLLRSTSGINASRVSLW